MGLVEEKVFARITELMSQMAGGDRAAAFAMYHEFGAPISATVRSVLATRGVPAIERDELDGLVIDVCTALRELAPSWSPDGGALPWVWARRRVGNIVDEWVGQHADRFEDHVVDIEARPVALLDAVRADLVDDAAAVFEQVAGVHPMSKLLREALERSGTNERDRRLLLEVSLQRSLGDRAPAATVGAMFGLSSAAVRQQVKRTRDRLKRVVASEPRYAPLASIPALAA